MTLLRGAGAAAAPAADALASTATTRLAVLVPKYSAAMASSYKALRVRIHSLSNPAGGGGGGAYDARYSSIKALLRRYAGSFKARLRLYAGSMQALLRLYAGTFKAL